MNRQPPMGGRQAGGPRGGGPHGAVLHMEKPKSARKTVIKLIKYIGKSKYLVLLLLLMTIIVTLLNLMGPVLQANAINSITISDKRLNVDFISLYKILILMLAVYFTNSGLSYFLNIFSAKLSQKTVYTMRSDLFRKIQYLPIKFTDTHQHGDIMSRMTNDVENVSNTISQSMSSMFSGVITIIGSVIIMLCYDWRLTLVSLITIPLSMFVTLKLSVYMRKFFKEQQTILGKLNGHVEEMITGYKTVISFGREKKAVRDFREISTNLKKVGIKAAIFGGVMGPMMNVIGNLSYLLIASYGGYLAFHDPLVTIGTIQAFLLLSKQFTRPINELANLYAQIQTAIAGAERIFEVMDSESEEDKGEIDLLPENVKGRLDFENIVFSYVKGEPVLKGFDLMVKPGHKIAIVGATGAGKTTVANLLTRFYDVDGGEILLDGQNITDITKASLRKNIAIVLQDTVLFSDTIANNIKYGNSSATDEEMKFAAKTANANVFIERLPDGYNTVLAESGNNLSQGQRQLLAIARAILANPKILILDEATSSVDTRTEMHIQKAMVELMKNRTSLIIAHRLSTIKDADLIVVIEGGRVSEAGNHKELLGKKGEYYKLYQTQYAGFAT